MICPNCEKAIANNIDQCPLCGCRFPVKELPKSNAKKPVVAPIPTFENGQQESNPKKMDTGKICPNCKHTISTTAMFCKFCGTQIIAQEAPAVEKIQEDIKSCPSCNKEVNATAAFCKWCGMRYT